MEPIGITSLPAHVIPVNHSQDSIGPLASPMKYIRSMRHVALPGALALLLTSVPLVGQVASPAPARPEPQATFKSGVEVVTVSVAIRDDEGKVIQNLTKADFEVFDSGRKQEIRDFFVGDSPVSLAILLDISGSMAVGGNMDRAREAVAVATMNLHSEKDEAALFTFDSELREVVGFTTDTRTIHKVSLRGKPWGQTEGMLHSIIRMLGLDLPVPDHTTLSRRSARLSLTTTLKKPKGPVNVVIDSSGLKIFGAGEWLQEKHGGKPRRSWRRLHLAVDPDSSEILAAELTTTDEGDASLVGPLLDQIDGPVSAVLADGAYDGEPTYRTILDRHPDAEVVIPPRSNAVLSDTADTEPTQRDRHIEMLANKGRIGWQKAVGYGKRSLVETAFHRYKVLIGRSLRARTLSAQKVEARIACTVINRMTSLGMPLSRKVP